MDINVILRLTTLTLLIIWRVYWFLTAKKATVKKPKTDNNPRIIEQIFANVLVGYIFVSLLGYVIFPFNNLFVQVNGFILVILGFIEGVVARKTLDDNWTNSNEYQIKTNHELITSGIYGYVRHPIYGGILLMVPGVLLVAGSYTFIAGLVAMLLIFEVFARREEKLLTKHFGKKYIEYMKTTKKFIPFVY
ncbi:MAG: isoprenylcysteine carboxylmethyltransferase family protein [Patescibacteria group bacterium]|jgi:protein-S-isoprenylcysteine O-methyltransferase Ste14